MIDTMNKFDEKYDIRLAHYDEIDEIMEFLDVYWKEGHILARDREFFEYEMVVDGQVNFIIAKDRTTGKISGLQGFLRASKDKENLDIWGCIWKVVPGSMVLLGVEIAMRMESISGARNFLSIGGNANTAVPINKKILKYEEVDKMKHFYCLSNRENYNIAKIEHYEPFLTRDCEKTSIKQLIDFEELRFGYDFKKNEDKVPYKDDWYLQHRYYSHPIYKYEVYGLNYDKSDNYQALLVCREQECNGEKVLRIVDYMGDGKLFSGLSVFLKQKLETYEYIDMYCYGFNEEYIRNAGMIEIEKNDTNIIPNYFNPYECRNVDIWIGTPKGRAVYFKADGDQDRPV